MKGVGAMTRMELALTLRRGESLLVTLGIPVGMLAFFSLVDVLPHDGRAVDFLVPGILALSIVSSAMTNLAIAVGFERQAGVLRRLGTTPLGRGGLFVSKLLALACVVVLQVLIVIGVAIALDWQLSGSVISAVAIGVLGLIAFGSVGFALAGRLRAETTLGVANGLFLVFLLTGGIVIEVRRLPDAIASFARALPAEPLATGLRQAIDGAAISGRVVGTLLAWAIAGCIIAILGFRWGDS